MCNQKKKGQCVQNDTVQAQFHLESVIWNECILFNAIRFHRKHFHQLNSNWNN